MQASNPPCLVGLRIFQFGLAFGFVFTFPPHTHTHTHHNEACLIQCNAMDLHKIHLVSATQIFFNAIYSPVNSLCKI